jgi:hypothetical protein
MSHSKKIIWALPSPGDCGSRHTWYKKRLLRHILIDVARRQTM